MLNNLAANPRALGEPTDSRKPLSSLRREIGLAAVAIELNLEQRTVQPDASILGWRGIGFLEADAPYRERVFSGGAALVPFWFRALMFSVR
jgi:hypothetical protein